ncbi:TonB-dependent receptor [Lentisphaera araneosa HTCC2155]|uniref:TonB-dependent receptor n=1 Tax=Lentisphaera araneosa HTCC2155 TaxID=313628 RepID=A6DS21_9BACT|nr:TonB-dependent receptor [Lentisphaera araneosa]EDM25596.1 TonB-dependent receptor [Lentisphaera araneosa HTCC2155]
MLQKFVKYFALSCALSASVMAEEAKATQAAPEANTDKKAPETKATETTEENTAVEKERVIVTGQIIPEGGHLLTGSSKRIDTEDIRKHSYSDINRVLYQVPGVNVREEDGYGLFPNISMRGINSHRSAKLTLMEDGILAAPAPYSAPDAYYSPNTGRMSAVEVIKGAASVQHGPHTTGGVVNYVSTPVPTDGETFYWKQLFGSNNDIKTHMYYGDVYDLDAGKLSLLFEGYYRENDGFNDIQHSDRNTGINHQIEPMLKLRFEPKTSKYQYLEMKVGYTDMEANLSYNGLKKEDFNSNPHDRYWGTQWDHMDTEAVRTYLKHYIELTNDISLTNTLYYNRFKRNWHKIKGDPGTDVLRGTAPGTIRLKNNNRDYYQVGLQSEVDWAFETGSIDHNLKVGTRIHRDKYDDYSWYDYYDVGGNYDVTGYREDVKGSAGNKDYNTESIAFFLHDEMSLTDKLTVTPGVRFEHISYDYNSKGETSDVDIWAPGIGFAYDFTNEYQLFGGVHKGFSVLAPPDAVEGGKYETSLSYELGLRYNNESGHYGAEAVVFYNDISDLYDPESQASGTEFSRTLGDAESYGLELYTYADAGKINNWGFSNPWTFAFTWTQSEITDIADDIDTSDPANDGSFYFGAKDGSETPYIPEFQYSIGTGAHFGKWGTDVNATYVDEMFTTAENNTKTDAHIIVDWSAYYSIDKNARVLFNVYNIFDEEYEAAHHPTDIRAGAPRLFYAGFEYKF